MTAERSEPEEEASTGRQWPKPATETLIARAFKLRCPRCGEDRMFKGLFSMNERCGHCDLKYERAPGYFLGSTYFSYGLTALVVVPAYVLLRFVLNYPTDVVRWPLAIFAVAFPLLMFRYARALWLAMDCLWDPGLMRDDHDE